MSSMILCVLFLLSLATYLDCIDSISSSVQSVLALRIILSRTIHGSSQSSPSIVVYRHVAGGFGNNMMGLVTSYVYAMKKDAVLYCRQ